MAYTNEPFPELCPPVSSEEVGWTKQQPTTTTNSNKSGRKSWSELRACVKEARRLQASLSNKVPSSFVFRQCGLRSRLYFLGVPHLKRENTIMYADVTDDGSVAEWKQLLDVGRGNNNDTQQFSREEQLLQERKRVGLKGLNSYFVHTQSGRIVFPCNSRLHFCQDVDLSNEPLLVSTCKTVSEGTKLDPKICPSNSQLIAYVCNGDIWLYDISTGRDHRLTFCRKGLGTIEDDALSAGVPSFIIQEEFDRYTGYWWQPLCEDTGTYRILYEEVDESKVDIQNIVTLSKGRGDVDKYRYPRAGGINATSSLRMLEFTMDDGEMVTIKILDISPTLHYQFPWYEYIVRADWLPDGQSIWVQMLDRPQYLLVLAVVPLCNFSTAQQSLADSPPAVPPHHVLQKETGVLQKENGKSSWINIHDILHFCTPDQPETLKFIWANERTGYRHLYLCVYDIAERHLASELPLTYGEWEVASDQTIHVDEVHGIIYFSANKDTPLEHHLYSVSMTTGIVQRLTPLGFFHHTCMNPSCSLLISTYSSVDTNACTKLFKVTPRNGNIYLDLSNIILNHADLDVGYKPPQLFACPLEGGKHTMYGMVYKPHNYMQGKKYPTVLFVYGGPQVQLVLNSNRSLRFLRLHTLASLGYVVVALDGRGSLGRGLEWERYMQHRMGTVEIADQVEGLQWLAANVDYIDMDRVAIHGWSYGGYLSLMGLIKRPDIFKVALSGAPVTSWEHYDTGYTERYMSMPDQNLQGYHSGSVLNFIDRFPDEENRLLITHGMIDENVHFNHTTLLIEELMRACKPYQLQIYPAERHGIRTIEANQHFETTIMSFLQQHL